MKSERIVTIGHVTNDTQPIHHLGGGATYSAVTAKRQGFDVELVTKCPPGHPYIDDLRRMGITVHVLPTKLSTITTFQNTYDENGKRKQLCLAQQESITPEDLPGIEGVLRGATIMVAPVIGEVDENLFPSLSEFGELALIPQGYFRKIERDGTVRQKKWNAGKQASFASSAVFSNEDITMDGTLDIEQLESIRNQVNTVALTQGENGSTVYQKGEKPFHAEAFHLAPAELRDFTGAGDVFAAALVTHYHNGTSIQEAANLASFYAALKIVGINGEGIASIPTRTDFELFSNEHPDRIQEFFVKNQSDLSKLFR